jgi:hypothetical protein
MPPPPDGKGDEDHRPTTPHAGGDRSAGCGSQRNHFRRRTGRRSRILNTLDKNGDGGRLSPEELRPTDRRHRGWVKVAVVAHKDRPAKKKANLELDALLNIQPSRPAGSAGRGFDPAASSNVIPKAVDLVDFPPVAVSRRGPPLCAYQSFKGAHKPPASLDPRDKPGPRSSRCRHVEMCTDPRPGGKSFQQITRLDRQNRFERATVSRAPRGTGPPRGPDFAKPVALAICQHGRIQTWVAITQNSMPGSIDLLYSSWGGCR